MFLGRANTDGDAVVHAPRQRVVAAGDIVVHPLPYASASYPTEWVGVLERIAALDWAYLVPGHGDVQTDRAYVERVAATLRAVVAQVAPLARDGDTLARCASASTSARCARSGAAATTGADSCSTGSSSTRSCRTRTAKRAARRSARASTAAELASGAELRAARSRIELGPRNTESGSE